MKKFLACILVIFSVGSMYYFSSQDSKTSSKQSSSVVELIDEIRNHITLKDENLIKIQDKVYSKLKSFGSKSYIVRKMAHFSIYAFIGISLTIFIYTFSRKLLLSSSLAFILSIIYACFDEYRQLSVDGRSGSLKDVFIDSSGALIGIIVLSFVIIFIKLFINTFKKIFSSKTNIKNSLDC